jgi:hypothetical protein
VADVVSVDQGDPSGRVRAAAARARIALIDARQFRGLPPSDPSVGLGWMSFSTLLRGFVSELELADLLDRVLRALQMKSSVIRWEGPTGSRFAVRVRPVGEPGWVICSFDGEHRAGLAEVEWTPSAGEPSDLGLPATITEVPRVQITPLDVADLPVEVGGGADQDQSNPWAAYLRVRSAQVAGAKNMNERWQRLGRDHRMGGGTGRVIERFRKRAARSG